MPFIPGKNIDTTAERYPLSGDFSQMGTQVEYLRKVSHHMEFSIENDGGIPIICGTAHSVSRALCGIWNQKIDGWFHYKDDLVRREICTADEFDEALDRTATSSV